MHCAAFLAVLRDAMPSRAELEMYGLASDEIDAVQATFRSVARKPLGLGSVQRSELEKMIVEYDCSAVEIGLIRFLDVPRKHHHGMQVALCEADPVVVWPDGTVAMHEHSDSDSALVCAADSERFLDALSVFIGIRREKSKWKGRVDVAAQACADEAGGNSYIEFFRLLCSFLA